MDDINEVGDNRHLTFFRMLGNWSLGDYFKKEQLTWIFAFLTNELGIPPKKLFVSVFAGDKEIEKDEASVNIWSEIFESIKINPKERIVPYGPEKNWWSRAGGPENMPTGELGGPDSEIFYDFGDEAFHASSPWKNQPCHINCECGRYLEISNNVFMQYRKSEDGSFTKLPQQNVDHGAGAERLLQAVENQPDVYLTQLFQPVIQTIEKQTKKKYQDYKREMRMITAHFSSSCFILNAGVKPSNTEQGYILRRLIRRAYDSFNKLQGEDIIPILESIAMQYKQTDPQLVTNFVEIKNTIHEETVRYKKSLSKAKSFLIKKYKRIDDHPGTYEIAAEDAFIVYTTHGLSPTQIKSLGFTFPAEAFNEAMQKHKNLSRTSAEKKFRGGLADHSEKTIMGHTATHLLHQAMRDILGIHVNQTGSNITPERIRFDFSHNEKLTQTQIESIEKIVNEKIKENLPVHFELIPTQKAYAMGAIGLFMDNYGEKSKIYFIGDTTKGYQLAYSVEFCGGPHVDFTGELKSFKIIKQENLGKNQRRIYALVGKEN